MSRIMPTSTCPECGYVFRLEDLRGKPIEFRRYSRFAPHIGCKVTCRCGIDYFVSWRRDWKYWSDQAVLDGSFDEETYEGFPNAEKGKFARKVLRPFSGEEVVEHLGYFTLSLSYYGSFNDEPGGSSEDPWHLCTDNAEDSQWVLD